jgi:YVTN family beta-propeller protein
MRRGFLLSLAAASLLTSCGQQDGAAPTSAEAPAAPAAFRIYATNESSGDLTVIDGTTNQVVATVPLGKRPRGIRLSPDGKFLFIALSGSPMAPPGVDEDSLPPPDKGADGIGVFDLAQQKVVRILRGVSDPEQTAAHPAGKIYVASEDTGQAVVLDANDGKPLATLSVGGEPEGVGISPDGRWVYVTSEEDSQVAVIDTREDKVVKTIKVGARPRAAAFSPDSRRAYVTGENDGSVRVVDVANHSVVNTVKLPGDGLLPMDVVVSPDGGRLYVSTGRGGSIAILDATSLSTIGLVKVGQRPWGIALSPDGKFLYTANGPSNDVSVVDTGTRAVVATIKVGERPWGVAIAPVPAP